jgi:hypothetical protein
MAGLFQIASPKPISAGIALEPVYNALNSLSLLNEVERMPALDGWVLRTAAALTPEQRHANRLIFEGLGDALLPEQDWPDFPAYLQDLATQSPEALRDRMLRRIGGAPADASTLAARVAQLRPDQPADAALQAEAYALLDDPLAMHDLIVAHLRTLWEMALATEWQRVSPPLQKMVGIVKRRLTSETAPIAENLRTFIGRAASGDIEAPPDGVQQLIFVPSPHTGRYVTRLYHDTTLRLFFHGPSNYPVVMRTSPVGRAELLTRLSALADDTRLRILELFAEQNELSAQEIMARLDLSQSSASRHLKQLSPYLIERRGEGASKIYSLGPTQVDLTFHALQRLLSGQMSEFEPLRAERPDYPRELQRFMDAHGRVTDWPAKERDRLLLLQYLAAQFEQRRYYTEKEVNALLIQHVHPIARDHAAVRRALYDYGLLDRERDGSRYWRPESRPVAAEEIHD